MAEDYFVKYICSLKNLKRKNYSSVLMHEYEKYGAIKNELKFLIYSKLQVAWLI